MKIAKEGGKKKPKKHFRISLHFTVFSVNTHRIVRQTELLKQHQ
jgi:hypothetical protein